MPGTYGYGLSGELDSSANWYKSQQIAKERFEWQKELDAINRQDTRDRAVLFRHDTMNQATSLSLRACHMASYDTAHQPDDRGPTWQA